MENPLTIESSHVADGPSSPVAQGLTDDEAARAAREQYREHGLPQLEPDDIVAPYLAPGERVIGQRIEASIARVDAVTRTAQPDVGPLYVTNLRLLHLGRQVTLVDLTDVDEFAIADERILLTIGGALGLMVDVNRPRELRVLLAAAKAAIGR